MHDALNCLIDTRPVEVRYEPLVELARHEVVGHRLSWAVGPGAPLCTIEAMRAAADGVQRGSELEYVLLEVALDGAVAAELKGLLVVELKACLLDLPTDIAAQLVRACEARGIGRTALVPCFEARALESGPARWRAALERLRAAGFDPGLTGLGRGTGDLGAWAELGPGVVILDATCTAAVDGGAGAHVTRALGDLGRALNSRVLATDIADAQQARDLADLGIELGSGEFFGSPAATPPDPGEALSLLALLSPPEAVATVRELIVDAPVVPPDMLIRDFVRLVYDQQERDAFPVVGSSGEPLGMVWRNTFLLYYSKPLHAEILARKPVSAVMDTAPLVIDARLRLEQASRLVTRKSRVHLTEQFIITQGGRYAGVGHTVDLLHHITRVQITRAAHSNPLTGLPGNLPIREHIDGLIGERRPFVVAYVDLDYFKPYNDAYGYARGDQLLLHVASILRGVVAPRLDFVGHLGGDDFVLVLRSADWAERLRRAVAEFARGIDGFYSGEHRRAGGIEATDRYGERRRFGLLTLSIAVADAGAERFSSAADLAERLQPIKARAKAAAGHSVLLATPTGVRDLLPGHAQVPGPAAATVAPLPRRATSA